jgi:cytidine deaminase
VTERRPVAAAADRNPELATDEQGARVVPSSAPTAAAGLSDQTAVAAIDEPRRYSPELIFAAVAPSGVDFQSFRDALASRLGDYGYTLIDVRLSAWLKEQSGLSAEDLERPDVRIPRLQAVGDSVRSLSGRGDGLAYLAIRDIAATRKATNIRLGAKPGSVDEDRPLSATAFLVWSLKHELEAEVLRQVYGSHFFLISIYSPAEDREQRLAKLMADRSGTQNRARRYLAKARDVIETDENEPHAGDSGQNVRDTYPMADFFVDGSTDLKLGATIERVVHVVFGYPFATPTKDEFAMYVADGAALRSAELGRQVGAAIATENGTVVATGTNEVPVFGGGHFWADPYTLISAADNREYRNDIDTSDKTKRQLADQVLRALQQAELLKPAAQADDLIKALDTTGLRDITEFGRAVHAELSACLTRCEEELVSRARLCMSPHSLATTARGT